MKRAWFTWVAYAIMICSLTTFAQPDTLWTRTYQIGGYPTEVFEASDGTFTAIFYDYNAEIGIQMMKFSSAGDSLWSRDYREFGRLTRHRQQCLRMDEFW